jgi:Gpi18-like mannosyltransferase
MKLNIILILAFGLTIRLFLGLSNHYTDVDVFFINWIEELTQFGFTNFYTSGFPVWQKPEMYYLFLKLPYILADLGLACGIGRIIYFLTNRRNLANWAICLAVFNPAILINSSYWGQIDVLPLFFLV